MAEDRHKEVVEPSYYTDLGNYSPVDVIEKWGLGFHDGNAVKYIGRAGRKEGESSIVALKKARWYLDRHIANLEALANA